MTESWFVTRIGEERYGLEMSRVDEVVRATKLVRVPQAPPALSGALLLRGRAIPVLDIRGRLGAPQRAIDPSCYFVIGTIDAARGALVVDFVEGLTELERSEIGQADLPHPEYSVGIARDMKQRPIVLLALSKILQSDEATQISAAFEKVAEELEAKDAER
jgi:purine-binding chemotaxis protein CheW